MNIRLVTREGTIPAKLPYEGAKFVEVEFPCSECGDKRVAGVASTRHHDHDTWRSEAVCVGCGARCGKLLATVETLFGINEDIAVQQRGRVYR